MTTDILDLIDTALDDDTVSPDAMRSEGTPAPTGTSIAIPNTNRSANQDAAILARDLVPPAGYTLTALAKTGPDPERYALLVEIVDDATGRTVLCLEGADRIGVAFWVGGAIDALAAGEPDQLLHL